MILTKDTLDPVIDNTESLPATQAPRGVVPAALMSKMSKAKHVDTFKAGELMIPWLRIVQTSSGYMKKNKAEYIKGAEEGDIIDTLTLRLRATQPVILVKFETHYTTWAPGGGKLVKQWFADSSGYDAATFPDGKNFGAKIDADGNEIASTPTYYILAVDFETGAADPMTMAWGSTQAKKTRRLNALARADLLDPESGLPFTPPIYARIFDLGTVGEQGNDKAWAGWTFNVGDLVLSVPKFGEMWYAKAEAFRDEIEKGNVRPIPPVENEEANADAESGRRVARPMGNAEATGQAVLDDDVPF